MRRCCSRSSRYPKGAPLPSVSVSLFVPSPPLSYVRECQITVWHYPILDDAPRSSLVIWFERRATEGHYSWEWTNASQRHRAIDYPLRDDRPRMASPYGDMLEFEV